MFHACTDETIKDFIISSFEAHNGTVRILAATVASGMGIDCKGVNLILHFGPPTELDSYFQESGRAGRDGSPSEAVLLLYPRSLGSKNISKEMKEYCQNSVICRRKLLLKIYVEGPEEKEDNLIPHQCCDICQLKCQCSESCSQSKLPLLFNSLNISSDVQHNKNKIEETVLSSLGKQELKNKLSDLQKQFLEDEIGLVEQRLSSGFPSQCIDEIVSLASVDLREETIIEKTCLFNKSAIPLVIKIINDILQVPKFGDTLLNVEPSDITSESDISTTSSNEETLMMKKHWIQ